jgi:superfamily II DNA or RNA helicase
MSALLQLRDYQLEAIKELHSRWDAGATRVPMVLATGLGKTVIFAHLVTDYVRATAGKRALVLVHTDELVQQAVKKIRDVAPELRVGIVKAAQNDVTARVIVASVQTLRNARRRAQVRNVGMIIVDECHHATAASYRAILEHFGALDPERRAIGGDPEVKVAGFTATLARGDKAKLSDVWQECTFQRGIAFGIRRGYLTDVRGRRVVVPDLDLKGVKVSGGDYQDGSLAEELDRALAPSIVAAAYQEHAADRKAIGFAPTVASAEHFATAFAEAGIAAAVVHGALPQEERRLILKRLRAGEIQVVWNCAVLTEGFDDDTISCVIMARPTKSAPLYQQCVGRGLRPDLNLPPAERPDCLVLDVVGASRTHNLRTLVDLSTRPEAAEELDEELSLLELEDALECLEQEEQGAAPVTEYMGETATIDFDPLARTGIGAWSQTNAGHYFLPAGEVYVLLSPGVEPGTYDVAWLTQKADRFWQTQCAGMAPYASQGPMCICGAGHHGSAGDVTEHQGLSLEMAASWAEEVLESFGADALLLADRRKRWRKGEPSAAQQAWCARNGVQWEGKTKGEVSDLMTTMFASRRIDPVVGFMISAREGMGK